MTLQKAVNQSVIMTELNRRFQILMSEEQMMFLKSLADQRGDSVGELVRKAVDQAYRPSVKAKYIKVLQDLESLDVFGEDFPDIPGWSSP